jgi:hypothetical protein
MVGPDSLAIPTVQKVNGKSAIFTQGSFDGMKKNERINSLPSNLHLPHVRGDGIDISLSSPRRPSPLNHIDNTTIATTPRRPPRRSANLFPLPRQHLWLPDPVRIPSLPPFIHCPPDLNPSEALDFSIEEGHGAEAGRTGDGSDLPADSKAAEGVGSTSVAPFEEAKGAVAEAKTAGAVGGFGGKEGLDVEVVSAGTSRRQRISFQSLEERAKRIEVGKETNRLATHISQYDASHVLHAARL